MHYKFTYDEKDTVQFDFDKGYELFGYWLKHNYFDDLAALDQLIHYCGRLIDKTLDDYQVSANSYYLQLTQSTAKIVGLSTLDAPIDQRDNKIDFNNPLESEVKMAVFLLLLNDWRNFLMKQLYTHHT